MRRVLWKRLASLSIAALTVLVVLSTLALVHPGAAGAAHPAAAAASVGHQPFVAPNAGNVTVKPTINNVPLATPATDPFQLFFTVTYSGVPAGLAVNNTTATFEFAAYNSSAPFSDTAIDPNTVSYAQTTSSTWSASGNMWVDSTNMSASGNAVYGGDSFTFQINSTVFATNASWDSSGSSTIVGPVVVPAVNAALATLTPPAASTPVPFTVNYTITATGATASAATTVAIATVWNATGFMVAQENVSPEVVAGTAQSFVVDYPFLTTLNFNNSNVPSGTYNLSLSWFMTNGFGLGSATTMLNSTVTITTFNVFVAQTWVMAVYQPLPVTVTWNVTGSLGFDPTASNTNQSLVVYDITAPSPTVTLPVPMVSIAVPFNGSQNSWTLTVSQILSGNYTGNTSDPLSLPTDSIQLSVIVTSTSLGGVRTSSASQHGFLVPVAPSASGVKAVQQAYGGVAGGLGNVTIFGNYSGTNVLKAYVTVTTSSGATALNASVLNNAVPGVRTFTVNWVPAAAGNYSVALTVSNAAGASSTISTSVSVIATGGAVITKNYWNNATLIPGLSTAASAALLLVVGLIVGLIVALLLGRMMWARPKSEPAQPWQAQATHECSVCHQTFATEDELKEHSKTVHGIE